MFHREHKHTIREYYTERKNITILGDSLIEGIQKNNLLNT